MRSDLPRDRRPWYRSRLFWLGSMGLVCCLWAWWNSMQIGCGIGWGRPGLGLFISHGQGSLRIGMDRASARSMGWDVWTWHGPDTQVTSRWPWLPPLALRANHDGAKLRRLDLPYWLLTVLLFLAWFAAAWVKQQQRSLPLPEEEQQGSGA